MWRVSSPVFDVEGFIRQYGLAPERIWRPGEKERGKILETSGFNVCIHENGTLEEGLNALRAFMGEKRDAIALLKQRGIRSTVDFGFSVGSDREFTRSLRFNPNDLTLLAEMDMELEISAYPSSDE